MPLILLLALLAVIAVIALVASGGGGSLSSVQPDRSPAATLPSGDLEATVLADLRFTVTFRGYRMDEVDAVLDRVSSELTTRDERIAELEARTPGTG